MKQTEIQNRCVAEVNLETLAENYRILSERVGPKTEVMAVVKADAYGHGAVKTACKLAEIGASHFGVATLEEAIELREAGIKGEILVFGLIDACDFSFLTEYGITPTMISVNQAKEYAKHKIRYKAHINLDTGMSRMGILCRTEAETETAFAEIMEIIRTGFCITTGIYTHFAISENTENPFTDLQFSLFSKVLDKLDKAGVDIPLRHCCNSAATILHKEMHLDMVRCGIALYGLPPVKTDLRLKPVLTLKARVVRVAKLKKGMPVSYGCRYVAKEDMEVATISIGYADGLSRLLSGIISVSKDGKEFPVIGTICMDLAMVGIEKGELKPGDFVEIFGTGDINADTIAKKIGTISYEILTDISPRVKRKYI
ncbi:MAG TPA: alanine racemase [Bacillota bacterium]|mgnify:CR=1 FL=1|nr:alanine racemase [Bacillota bacterium]HPF42361.1 alanine racemase [Bacillota bacterium]HPJ86148.1 alanine racemase [Bacillota bacterium]HPQ61400.1 alanine racemase [Bacillota bacterium]HRX91636.1 alanine racemase [Candidatus Izemoplasmatales bacterium]